MEDDAALHLVDACNGIALLVGLGIATRDQHDTDGCTLVERNLALIEIALSHTLEQVHDVALQAQHDALRLGVAHTAVILDDVGFGFRAGRVGAVDESEEDKSLIVNAFGCQAFDGGTDDTVLHLLHPRLRGEGNGRDRAHAASVQTGVVLANTLVVLGLRQNLVVLTVCQHEHGTLDATHELLDDDTRRGVAEHAAQHLLQFFLGLVEGRQNQHTLASAQAVGLEHVGGFERFQELQTILQMLAVECLVACRGDVVAQHESLGKVLRAFQHGTSLRGTDDGDVLRALVLLQVVVDTLHQRVFRTYYHHVDAFFHYECLDGLEVVSLHGHILSTIAGASVAWSNIELLTLL